MESVEAFLGELEKAIINDTYVKVSLSGYKGEDKDLKKVLVRKIRIKKQDKLSFIFRYQTNDVTKNYTIEEGILVLKEYLEIDSGIHKKEKGVFDQAILFSLENDIYLRHIRKGKPKLQKQAPTQKKLPSSSHNKQKSRHLDLQNAPYLYHLGITNKNGEVHPSSQDKYKQINHFIELIKPLVSKQGEGDTSMQVLDMGAGKGYLTFALYDYLKNVLNYDVRGIGVEFRKDLVDFCNQTAREIKFDHLQFMKGSIESFEDFDSDKKKMLIALHACDTATDDAIYKGIKHQAEWIVVAPCCHKQIRREMENHKKSNELSSLTNYGTFLERQAEMVTDTIRTLLLNIYGYQTKVLEFVSDAHTPKNVLIIASKAKGEKDKLSAQQKLTELKEFFGIKEHHLEVLLSSQKI